MSRGLDKVLYHAVSSYQLLEVLLHRWLFHGEQGAALVLPDFIVEKYPQWQRLEGRGFFDQVALFPYLRIPHGEEGQVTAQVLSAYDALGLPPLEAFSKVYVAGAQFYFSLCLVAKGLAFSFFEDAAGALSHPQREAGILAERFPRHAALAQKHGLFSGENPLIREVFCCGEVQSAPVSLPCPVWDFSVERALGALPARQRKRLLRFFLPRPLKTQADTILLTQQFSNLGLLGEEEQLALYRALGEGPWPGSACSSRRPPTTPLDYRQAFPGAEVVAEKFPAELLPWAFRGKRPRRVCAFGSSAWRTWGRASRRCGCPCRGRPAPSFGKEAPMPKTLTIVNSVYHLLTAVNLRRLSPAGEGADLLVTDATPGLPELIPRLRETGLFSRVLPVRAGELAQHYPMNREEAVAQCFSQGEALLRWALGEALEPAYSQVYFPNFDWLGPAAGLPVPVPLPLAGGRLFQLCH